MNKLVKVVAPIVVVLTAIGSLFMVTKVSDIKKKQATEIQDLTGNLNSTKNKLATTEGELKDTKSTLLGTQNKLAETDQALTNTKTDLEQKNKTLGELQTTLASKEKELADAKTSVTAMQEEATQIKAKIAEYEAQPIDKLKASIKELEDKVGNLANENKVLGQQLVAMKTENAKLLAEKEDWTTTPVTVRGAVTSVQDRWGFVVLNVGEQNHVRKEAKFLVYRDSKLICKLQIVSVYPNTSIAEVLEDYQRGEPRVGDLVLR